MLHGRVVQPLNWGSRLGVGVLVAELLCLFPVCPPRAEESTGLPSRTERQNPVTNLAQVAKCLKEEHSTTLARFHENHAKAVTGLQQDRDRCGGVQPIQNRRVAFASHLTGRLQAERDTLAEEVTTLKLLVSLCQLSLGLVSCWTAALVRTTKFKLACFVLSLHESAACRLFCRSGN